jgi:uncharacterized membrane protein
MFRVKNRDKQPQFFDKHLSKTRKIEFRILMRSDALWYSDHSSSASRVYATRVLNLSKKCFNMLKGTVQSFE